MSFKDAVVLVPTPKDFHFTPEVETKVREAIRQVEEEHSVPQPNVRLAQRKQLLEIAQRRGCSLDEIVERAIDSYLQSALTKD